MLTGPLRLPASGKPAQQLVVILHGWGADGANLIDLADMFATVLPDAQFIAPDGPEVCDMNPYGYQWFSLTDRNPERMFAEIKRTADTLNAFLDAQLQHLRLKPSQLALVGFSQGTMMALHVALRHKEPIACVVGFSGALLGAEALASEISTRMPVTLIHGADDDIVPYASLAHAETMLTRNAVPVQTHTRPGLSHSIDMEGIEIAKKALVRGFN